LDYEVTGLWLNVSPVYVYGVDVTDGSILWKINHLEALGKDNEEKEGRY
jgi:hypothetical protein